MQSFDSKLIPALNKYNSSKTVRAQGRDALKIFIFFLKEIRHCKIHKIERTVHCVSWPDTYQLGDTKHARFRYIKKNRQRVNSRSNAK